MKRLWVALLIPIFLCAPAAARQTDTALRASLQRDIDQYLTVRSKIEHVSAISLSVSLHGEYLNINLAAGRTQYGGGVPLTTDSLWQIGSNTKAFTAAIILQLEAEGVLTIDQTVGHWLPQYPAWKSVTIRRLLNMSSGIPTYDDAPAMLAAYAKDPQHDFTLAELIAYAYPSTPNAPKPTSGYSYSNTNYLLAELIIQRATHNSYKRELEQRFFRSDLALTDTFYEPFRYSGPVLSRLPAGYFVNNDPDNAPLAPIYGHDVSDDSVSWMQGAGGIVSTPEDLTRWARALYTGPTLAPKQRTELMSLVSTSTGRPIDKTSSDYPRGFGLGVAQMTVPDLGTIWFYEGESLGFRMVHFYLPRQDAVIAFGLNSRPPAKEDQVNRLAVTIYNTLHAAGRI